MPEDVAFSQGVAMPGLRAAAPATPAEARGRFFSSANAFDIHFPPVPARALTAEWRRACAVETPTGLIPCDLSVDLGCAFAATTPLLLAAYAKLRSGETLTTDIAASGAVAYVIRGSGVTACAGESIVWGPGDIFVLPGGAPATHSAETTDSILWMVSDAPHFALARAQPPAPGLAATGLVHFRAAEIARQLEPIYALADTEGIAGAALIFSGDRQESTRNILPTITLALNSLPAGRAQRAHRHNSTALSLVLQGEGCFSWIDGQRTDWEPWATLVTPPGAVHSHHNKGARRAHFLVVQDGGLYYHARTMGFAFVDEPR